MNYFLIAAGVLAAFVLVGHSTLGRSQFFLPMRAAPFDAAAKRAMEFVWHMTTVVFVLPPAVLIYGGINAGFASSQRLLISIVAAQFAAWGLVHLALMATSLIPGAVLKMFQWILFIAVAAMAFAGLA